MASVVVLALQHVSYIYLDVHDCRLVQRGQWWLGYGDMRGIKLTGCHAVGLCWLVLGGGYANGTQG